jgi:hypothetical protein
LRKNHCVHLEEDIVTLAGLYGMENLSEFVRDALTYFVSENGEELTKSQIREILKRFAIQKRAKLQSQMKISQQTDEERLKIIEIQERRFKILIKSVESEAERIGIERFRKYLADEYGDYSEIQDDIMKSVSEKAGFEVQLSDIIKAFRVMP